MDFRFPVSKTERADLSQQMNRAAHSSRSQRPGGTRAASHLAHVAGLASTDKWSFQTLNCLYLNTHTTDNGLTAYAAHQKHGEKLLSGVNFLE